MRKLVIWFSFCVLFLGTGDVFTVNATPRLAQVGRAYQFDGVDDYVDLGNLPFRGTDSFKVEFDFKTTDTGNNVLFEVGGNIGFSIQTDTSSTGKIIVNINNSNRGLSTDAAYNDGKIHKLTFERNGTTDMNTLTIDLNTTQLSKKTTFAAGTQTYIGGRGSVGNYSGVMGDIKIYDENNKLLHSWHADESSGVRTFDAIQKWYEPNDIQNPQFSNWTSTLPDNFTINGDGNVNIEKIASGKPVGVSGYAVRVSGGGTGYDGLQQSNGQGFSLKPNTDYEIKVWTKAESGNASIRVYSGSSGYVFQKHYPNTEWMLHTEIFNTGSDWDSNGGIFWVLKSSVSDVFQAIPISIKEVHEPAHGTITNADEATFHIEDRDFTSYQNTLGYAEEVPQEELIDISTPPSVLGGSATTTYENEIRRITGNNTSVSGSLRWSGLIPNPLDLRNYKVSYDARSNVATKIYSDIVDDWISRPLVTSDFQNFSYEIAAQNLNPGLDFVDFNVTKVGGGNLLATDYGEIKNASVKEISLPGQFVPRALDEDGNGLVTDIFGNYMDGSRRAAMNDSELYLDTPVADFDGVNDYVAVGNLNEEALSGMVRFYTPTVINNSTGYTPLLNFGTDLDSFLHLGALTGTLTDEIIVLGGWGVNCSYWASSTAEISAGWHTLSWSWDGSKNQLYLDGVAITTQVAATPAIINPINFNIGTFNNGYAYFGGSLSEVRLYNRALSATEILNLHNGNSITSGLIAQYNFSEGGGDTVYDKVPAYLGPELIVNGDFSNGLTGWSYANATATIQSGNLHAVGTGTIPVNQTVSNAVVVEEGKLYEVQFEIIDTQTSANAGIIVAGGNDFLERGVHYYYPNTKGIHTLHFRAVGTASIALSLHVGTNVGSTAIFGPLSVKEVYEPAHGTITNANLSTFWTNDDTSRSDNLLDGFSKGLQSIGPGRMYKPSKVAYGTWEFDFNFRIINNNRFYFISNTSDVTAASDGYYVRGVSGGAIELRLFINGSSSTVLMKTADGYIQDNKNYKLRIERASNGTFTCYIKGENFGDDWVLMNVSGGGGTNPATNNMFTESEYILATLKGNDMISNLKINGTPVNVHTFTNGTGGYSKVNIPAQSGNTGKDVFKNLLAQPTTVNSVVNRLRLSALRLVTVGRRYWDTSYKKFFLGDTNSSFVEFPASDYVVPQTTLNTLDTNKTAVPGRLYYDTTERAFKKGASDGSVIDY